MNQDDPDYTVHSQYNNDLSIEQLHHIYRYFDHSILQWCDDSYARPTQRLETKLHEPIESNPIEEYT